MLWKCCTQYTRKIGKLSSDHRTGKGQFSSQSQRKVMPKNAQTTSQLHSPQTLVMLKILQPRLQQYVNRELPGIQAGFRKGRGTRNQLTNIHWIIEKARVTSALLTTPNHLTVWITINCGKFKRWEYQTTWPASWEICMQVRKQQLELDMEQQTGSKPRKEYIKTVYCHPAYLTYMQSISWEVPGWMKHKLESRLPGKISITSDMQITPPLWQKAKNNLKAS